VERPPGRLIYTQMLNTRGGIECDLTVARLAEDHYYIVTGTGFRTHDFAWIVDHIPAGAEARLADVTEDYATLVLMGPRARDIMGAATTANMSNAAFPFGAVQVIPVAGHPVRALRVTYVGELGWELHMAKAAAGAVFDALMAAGGRFGITPAGYRAIESLRLEKFYRAWAADITPNDTPFQAGLGWAVKLKGTKDFIGRTALEAAQGKPLTKMLAGFVTEREDVVLAGRETILRNGQFAGYLTSGGYGYSVGRPVGLGYIRNADGVDAAYVEQGSYELVVANEAVKATVHLKPLWDPENLRVKS
jgi:4-methylaminobutanoate oxidase (formaldehyde-forming)